jgi:hypothetical protein
VTFTKDIAPILQRSCQNCHRPDGVAPMSLVTYEDVRPWVRSIKQRTGVGPHAGVMPPWYIEKNVGIQRYQDDPSLSAEEIARIARWAGLHVSWFVYRGAGRAIFEPAQTKVWEDTRVGANSPWAPRWVPPQLPADGKWQVQATFDDPGTYVLRARADDGALSGDDELTVIVTR